jgi:hypothetical protein
MPIVRPAASTPSGLPSPPRMTTEKITPIHVKICAGNSVEMSAMNPPATPA